MFSKSLMILVISVLISAMDCTRTEEKIYGEGICQYPQNCTQPQLPPPSTDQPNYGAPPPSTDQPNYGVPPPKPKSPPPVPEQPVPTGYSPYTTTPPPPPAASIYPENCPPPPSPPAAEGQYSEPPSYPPPNPYTYLNETTNSADAPPSALPLFYILFLFAYYA